MKSIKFIVTLKLLDLATIDSIFNLLLVELAVVAMYISYALVMKQLFRKLFSETQVIWGISAYWLTLVVSVSAYVSFVFSLTSIFLFAWVRDWAAILNTLAIALLYVSSACFAITIVKTWRLPREQILLQRATSRLFDQPK